MKSKHFATVSAGHNGYNSNYNCLYERKITINDLEHKNTLLSDNIDEDYIDILIREKLMLGKKGESTYIIIDNES